MAEINFENLLSTGAHFGHVTRKWHPEYAPYILMEKNGIHIINLDETIQKLDKALAFVSEIAQKNGEFLFVGTKKQARDIIQQEADRCGMFYVVERWLGGTLTNFSTIKKSIKRLQLLEKEGLNIYENLTKKEIQMLNRERIKLADQHRGIKDMKRLPEAIVVVDANHEITAVREARLLEIPVIAIVDTNTNPNSVDYPIPANDDSIRTIQLIISAISDEILTTASGKEKAPEETSANDEQELPKEQVEVAEENVAAEQVTETVEAANEDVTADQAKEEAAVAETDAEEESEEVKETVEDAEVT
jgi:small subunit ribosomal protein S2